MRSLGASYDCQVGSLQSGVLLQPFATGFCALDVQTQASQYHLPLAVKGERSPGLRGDVKCLEGGLEHVLECCPLSTLLSLPLTELGIELFSILAPHISLCGWI